VPSYCIETELDKGAQSLPGAYGRSTAPKARILSAQVVSWLLDADVLSQPAKRHGDPRVIAWLESEQDDCYTSAVVLAQLAYWVRSKEGRADRGLNKSWQVEKHMLVYVHEANCSF
jgi:hypothetical protein